MVIILNKDIEIAELMIRTGYRGETNHTQHSLLYPVSTENISGYFEKLNFNGKKILTVAGSGDHAFNSILYGAQKTDVFDINRFCKYYLFLKKAAINTLNYEEFLDYFLPNSSLRFSSKYYKLIREELFEYEEILKFWDEIYLEKKTFKIYDSLHRKIAYPSFSKVKKINKYLNEIAFYKLKSKIDNFEILFWESNILNLQENVKNNKYDIILLSNISDYIHDIFSEDHLENFKKLVLSLQLLLNDNGTIVFGYIYDLYLKKPQHTSLFTNNDLRESIFYENNFKNYKIDSYRFDDGKDAVYMYQKGIRGY